MIVEKVSSLKKLKFTQEYESWKDKETYEWMKYKVAAEVGGDQELESFRLYEKVKIDQKGESGYRLWRDQIEKDPAAQQFLTHFWREQH